MPYDTFSGDASGRAGKVRIVSTNKNSRKAELSNVERSLDPSKALAKVEFIVPKRQRIDEDDERECQTETWHSFQSP